MFKRLPAKHRSLQGEWASAWEPLPTVVGGYQGTIIAIVLTRTCDILTSLWNGKVVPLLRNTIKGTVWMQGEANSRADGRQYNCSFPAMIEDWRAKWAEGTGGTTDSSFPFGWSQVRLWQRVTV